MANACGACQFRIVGLHPFPPVEPIRAIQVQATNMHRRSRGTICPRFASKFCPSKTEGAGNAGCALHPRSRAQCAQKGAHTSIQVQRRRSDIPCAMALRLITCSPRRPGFVATVAARINPAQLDTSVGVSEPHDFAVRFRAVRQKRIRVHRSLSHVRDDGRRPSEWDGIATSVPVICLIAEAKYFCFPGLTPFRKIRSDLPVRAKSAAIGQALAP